MSETRTFWGKWDCTQCGRRGISAEPPPGEKQAACGTCGSPREQSEGEVPYLDNRVDSRSGRVLDANVADTEEEISIAHAGPDWKCPMCGGDNRARMANCHGCGADREKMSRLSGRKGKSGLPVELELGLMMTAMEMQTYGKDPAPRREPKPAATPDSIDPDSRAVVKRGLLFGGLAVSGTSILAGFAVVVLSVLCGGAIFWAFSTHDVNGKVAAMSWKHTTHRETFTLGSSQAWQSDISGLQPIMPVDGRGERAGEFDVTGCYQKWHHDRHYQCGTKQVPVPKTRRVAVGSHPVCSPSRSNGNGSFSQTCRSVTDYRIESYTVQETRPEYCDDPIYKPWCTYSTYRWKRVETKDKAGVNPTTDVVELPWPSVPRGALDRLIHEEEYHIDWSYGEPPKVEHVTRDPANETEFLGWAVGDPAVVTEFNMGAVQSIRHSAADELLVSVNP